MTIGDQIRQMDDRKLAKLLHAVQEDTINICTGAYVFSRLGCMSFVEWFETMQRNAPDITLLEYYEFRKRTEK